MGSHRFEGLYYQRFFLCLAKLATFLSACPQVPGTFSILGSHCSSQVPASAHYSLPMGNLSYTLPDPQFFLKNLGRGRCNLLLLCPVYLQSQCHVEDDKFHCWLQQQSGHLRLWLQGLWVSEQLSLENQVHRQPCLKPLLSKSRCPWMSEVSPILGIPSGSFLLAGTKCLTTL